MKITFCSGAGTVTGSNFLIETSDVKPKKYLVDCGLIQGGKIFEAENFKPFGYDPNSIEAVFITHAHIDHVGRLPRLVHQGFRGVIHSTAPTRVIAELNLLDSLGVMQKEARISGREEPLYTEEDVTKTMTLWQTLEYGTPLELGELTVTLCNAGHILGSAMVVFSSKGKKLVFTGDLGNSPTPLLPDTDLVNDIDYLIIESVYGDRVHDGKKERKRRLESVIENTVGRGGVLVIPAFSIERTQELLFEIEEMTEGSRIPVVPVYLDSPLAIKVTRVYNEYVRFLNLSVQEKDLLGDGIFRFPNLHQTLTTEESKAIFLVPGPKIIIAGSGMSNGGRILHHERHYLGDKKNALLLVGYQAGGSLGRLLLEGARSVRIMGEEVRVEAQIVNLTGYSAHRDSDGLLDFVKQSADTLKKVFVVLGEPRSSLFLVQRIRDYLGLEARAPQPSESIELPL